MEGLIVNILEYIDPTYLNDLIYLDRRGRKCMYAEAKKAIDGTLEASLLFWMILSRSL